MPWATSEEKVRRSRRLRGISHPLSLARLPNFAPTVDEEESSEFGDSSEFSVVDEVYDLTETAGVAPHFKTSQPFV